MNLMQESIGEHEVEKEEWRSFLDGFCNKHQQRAVVLEMFAANGRSIEARSGRLLTLVIEGTGHAGLVYVELEQVLHGRITHVLAAPVQVTMRQFGAYEELTITSDDGRRTILQCEGSVRFTGRALPTHSSAR